MATAVGSMSAAQIDVCLTNLSGQRGSAPRPPLRPPRQIPRFCLLRLSASWLLGQHSAAASSTISTSTRSSKKR
ncbi:hypothetical protein ACP70R_002859 [Stipagrostis hirtigluma subsp. patula]